MILQLFSNLVVIRLLAYEDGTECFETSAFKIQTPGKYPEENIQQKTSSIYNIRGLSCGGDSQNSSEMAIKLNKGWSYWCSKRRNPLWPVTINMACDFVIRLIGANSLQFWLPPYHCFLQVFENIA
jgi:hypothetical protein